MGEPKVKAFGKVYKKMHKTFRRAEQLKNIKTFLFMSLVILKSQDHFSTNVNPAFSVWKHRAYSLYSVDIISRTKCLCFEFILR